MERTLYNGLISGVSLDGKTFFYPNPLESATASTRAARGSASPAAPATSRASSRRCPATSTRSRATTIYVNLFAAGTADITLDNGRTVKLTQETRYPWDGAVHADRRRRIAPADVHHQRAHPGLGAQRAGAERPLPVRDTVGRSGGPKVNGSAVPDHARQGLRHPRARRGSAGDVDRPRPADADPARRRERRTSRPIAAASPSSAAPSCTPPSGRTTRAATCATSCCPTRRAALGGVPARPAERRHRDHGPPTAWRSTPPAQVARRPSSRSPRFRTTPGPIAAAAR